MNLVLYFILLEFLLVLTVLWLNSGLRRGSSLVEIRRLSLSVLIALTGLTASIAVLDKLFGRPQVLVFLAVVALLYVGWIAQHLLWFPLQRLRSHFSNWLVLIASPALYMLPLLLLLMFMSMELLGRSFVSRVAAEAIPAQWLSLVMRLNLLTGALLLAGAMAGLLGLGGFDLNGVVRAGCDNAPLDPMDVIVLNFRRFLFLSVLRFFALGFSLGTCAQYNPLGPKFFFQSLIDHDLSMIVLRVLLGLFLPACYALLGLEAVREDSPDLSRLIFLPLLLLVVAGELIACSLTVGLWGIAF